MEPHSQPKASDTPKNFLDAQLRESFGRVIYTHKVHEKEADILLGRLSKIKLGQIILPAISAGGFVAMLLDAGWWGSLVGAILSTILFALNLYTKNYDLAHQAQQHKDAAIRIWSIREEYLSLITDLATGSRPLTDIQLKRDALVKELGCIYAKSPSTTTAAYKKAQKALKLEEELTFSVKEVDSFLPQVLRRTE